MPDQNLDPHLATVLIYADRLRAELDRCDAAIADYPGPGRHRIETALLMIRELVVELDKRLGAEAAGL